MDISGTVQTDSDQLDAIDLQMSGPRTFTITKVSKGKADQPVQISLAEFPRVWRPGKSMRRVLVAAWSPDASTYVGRRVTLYCDPNVRFGSDLVGGTRISNMTDLPGGKRLSISLPISRGKSAMFTVEPLADATPAQTANPNAELLAEIGALADKTPGGRKAVAADWAKTHEGEHLRDATDLGGLELLRDDLKASAA
jgi:hypothetical protein